MRDITVHTAHDAIARDWSGVDVAALAIGRDTPHPAVTVMTSWLPVQRRYETWVTGDYDSPVLSGVLRRLGTDEWHYDTREAAQDGHADVLRRIYAYLAAVAA